MFKRIFRQFAAMAVIASSSICIGAQTGASAGQVNSIAVSITLDKSQFNVGESPVVILTMNNPTTRDLYLHGNWDRVHIEGTRVSHRQSYVNV